MIKFLCFYFYNEFLVLILCDALPCVAALQDKLA